MAKYLTQSEAFLKCEKEGKCMVVEDIDMAKIIALGKKVKIL